jgi:import inner membrane translocase subunit TIM22
MTIQQCKFLVPLFPAGQEPLPPGIFEEERPQYEQNKKIEKYMGMAAESCAFKSATAGVLGL